MSETLKRLSSGFDASIQASLQKHGASMSSRDFLRIASEVSQSATEPLTAGERNFLLEHTDLVEDDLSTEQRTNSKLFVLAEQARSQSLAENSAYTASEVAQIVGLDETGVRQAEATGDYYAFASADGRQSLFPKWQFTDDGVLPGLKQILGAFPRFYHPLAIEALMTQPNEDYLGGRSPIDWLLAGGTFEEVVAMVSELEFR